MGRMCLVVRRGFLVRVCSGWEGRVLVVLVVQIWLEERVYG